jgi:pimeloyl-ACP methyl ester carboxylesterase
MISDQHETEYFKIGDIDVPVWIYGDRKKPLIYFIHGYFRGFSDYFGDLPIRYLMKDYCVIAFDLPGFGYMKEVDMDRLIFMRSVIDKTNNGKKFTLFGMSYGGLLSLRFAHEFPKGINGIILGGMPYFGGIRKVIHLSHKLPILKTYTISRILKEFTFLTDSNLAKIKFPILLLYSSKDRHATLGMAKKIEKMVPNSKLFSINRNNHGWLMHRIDESGFLKEIQDFMRGLK